VRGFLSGIAQILTAAVVVAAIGGLIGFVVVHFAGWGGAATGFGWGMIVAGGLVGFVAGGSGSPSENLVRGRTGAFGTYWGQSAALPQSPLWLALGGLLAFAGGIGLIVLAYYY
jgi:ABC-type antimicrobial peptide transport system permease subunit